MIVRREEQVLCLPLQPCRVVAGLHRAMKARVCSFFLASPKFTLLWQRWSCERHAPQAAEDETAKD
jgi:hypothetical protein